MSVHSDLTVMVSSTYGFPTRWIILFNKKSQNQKNCVCLKERTVRLFYSILWTILLSLPSLTLASSSSDHVKRRRHPTSPIYSRQHRQQKVEFNIYNANLNEANSALSAAIEEAKAVIVSKARALGSREDKSGSFSYTVQVKTSDFDSFLSKLQKIGKISSQSGKFELDEENIEITIQLTDSKPERYKVKKASLFAGVTAGYLNLDLENDFKRSMLGVGLTLVPGSRWAYMSLISLREVSKGNDSKGPSASGSTALIVGHNYKSSLFGEEDGLFFNPYAGVNYGVARLYGNTMLAIGGTLGIELINAEWFNLSAAAQLSGLYSSKNGGTYTRYFAQLALPF